MIIGSSRAYAHVDKFYSRLRFIRSAFEEPTFSVFKIDSNCNFKGLLHNPFMGSICYSII